MGFNLCDLVAWEDIKPCVFCFYDIFEAHVVDSAKENTNLAVICGILISVLQPFDASLNNGGWEKGSLT